MVGRAKSKSGNPSRKIEGPNVLPVKVGERLSPAEGAYHRLKPAAPSARWSLVGAPPWLGVDPGTGALLGAAPTEGEFVFTLRVVADKSEFDLSVTIRAQTETEAERRWKAKQERQELAKSEQSLGDAIRRMVEHQHNPWDPPGEALLNDLRLFVSARGTTRLRELARTLPAGTWRDAVLSLENTAAIDTALLRKKHEESCAAWADLKRFIAQHAKPVRLSIPSTSDGPDKSQLDAANCLRRLQEQPVIGERVAASVRAARFDERPAHLGLATLLLEGPMGETTSLGLLLHSTDVLQGTPREPQPNDLRDQRFLDGLLDIGLSNLYAQHCPPGCHSSTIDEFLDRLYAYGFSRTEVAREAKTRLSRSSIQAEDQARIREELAIHVRRNWTNGNVVDPRLDPTQPKQALERLRTALFARVNIPDAFQARLDLTIPAQANDGFGIPVDLSFAGIRVARLNIVAEDFPYAACVLRDVLSRVRERHLKADAPRINETELDNRRRRVVDEHGPGGERAGPMLDLLAELHACGGLRSGAGLREEMEAALTVLYYTAARGEQLYYAKNYPEARQYYHEYLRLRPRLWNSLHDSTGTFDSTVILYAIGSIMELELRQAVEGAPGKLGSERENYKAIVVNPFEHACASRHPTRSASALLDIAHRDPEGAIKLLQSLPRNELLTAFYADVYLQGLRRAMPLQFENVHAGADRVIAHAACRAFRVLLLDNDVVQLLSQVFKDVRGLQAELDPSVLRREYQSLTDRLTQERVRSFLEDLGISWNVDRRNDLRSLVDNILPPIRERLVEIGSRLLGEARLTLAVTQSEMVRVEAPMPLELCVRNHGNRIAEDVEIQVDEVRGGTLTSERLLPLGRIFPGRDHHFELPVAVAPESNRVELSLWVRARSLERINKQHQIQVLDPREGPGKLGSLYFASQGVQDPRRFFGRRHELAQIVQQLMVEDGPDHPLVIHGRRKVGKSSIILRLMRAGDQRERDRIEEVERFQARRLAALVDFELVRRASEPEKEVFSRIVKDISRSLREIEGFPTLDWKVFYSREDSRPAGLLLEDYFEEVSRWLAAKGRKLVLFLDEFDTVIDRLVRPEWESRVGDHGDDDHWFFSLLRGLLSRHADVLTMVFCGQERLVSLLQSYSQRLHSLTPNRPIIGPFGSEEEARDLVEVPLKERNARILWAPGVVDDLLRRTARYPFFLQAICNRLVPFVEERQLLLITHSHVQHAIDEVLKTDSIDLKDFWEKAGRHRLGRLTLSALVHATDVEGRDEFSVENLVSYIENAGGSGISTADVREAADALRGTYALAPDQRSCRLAVPLLGDYLRLRHPLREQIERLGKASPL